MKSVTEILELAVTDIENLPKAMLYAKLLADDLGDPLFSQWVNQEVNGYDDDRSVPDYRLVRGKLVGDFEVYLQSTSRQDVPFQTLGEDVYILLSTIRLKSSVSALSTMRDDGSVHFTVGMQQEVLGLINCYYTPPYRFIRVLNYCPTGSLTLVLAEIQRKLVSVLSELRQVVPEAADLTAITSEEQQDIQKIVTHHFHLGPSFINSGPGTFNIDQSQQDNRQIHVGSWEDMKKFLEAQRIGPKTQAEGKAILDKIEDGDVSDETKDDFRGWVEKASSEMVTEVGEAIKEETKNVAAKKIVDIAIQYAPRVAMFIANLPI